MKGFCKLLRRSDWLERGQGKRGTNDFSNCHEFFCLICEFIESNSYQNLKNVLNTK